MIGAARGGLTLDAGPLGRGKGRSADGLVSAFRLSPIRSGTSAEEDDSDDSDYEEEAPRIVAVRAALVGPRRAEASTASPRTPVRPRRWERGSGRAPSDPLRPRDSLRY